MHETSKGHEEVSYEPRCNPGATQGAYLAGGYPCDNEGTGVLGYEVPDARSRFFSQITKGDSVACAEGSVIVPVHNRGTLSVPESGCFTCLGRRGSDLPPS